MATGNDNLLQRLRKLLAEAANTSDLREPWQELFGRQDSVPPRAMRAAEAVKGFAGSWAASYSIDQSTTPTSNLTSAPRAGFDSLLGKRGYPEINFVPYNCYQSNRGKEKTTSVMSRLMFIVGLIIFVLYMWGYIAMINQTHASQSRKAPDDLGPDEFSEG